MSPLAPQRALAECYWAQARRPLSALLFLLPLLAIYELGVLSLGGAHETACRNGADFWMREWLFYAGLRHPWLLPGLVIVLLGGWHLWERHPWRCSLDTLVGMFAESLLFALGLVLLGQLLHIGFERDPTALSVALGPFPPAVARAVSYLGAGIYEEVLFRLGLLPASVAVLRWCLPRGAAVCTAVLATSLLFAAAHYAGTGDSAWTPAGLTDIAARIAADPAHWFSFTFRCLAGIAFCVIFLRRGFGVTVGCHAVYDLLVGVIMLPAAQ